MAFTDGVTTALVCAAIAVAAVAVAMLLGKRVSVRQQASAGEVPAQLLG